MFEILFYKWQKCSRNGLKVGVRPYYSVGRPLVKFHRVRSPFDAPTDNYSGSIAGLSSDVFGLRKQMPGPLSLFSPSQSRHKPPTPSSFPSSLPELSDATARSETLSAQCIEPLTCASEIVPDPTRAVVTVGSGSSPNVYKTSPFSYLDSLAYFSRPPDFDRRVLPQSYFHIKDQHLRNQANPKI